jgi:hypothetical protein
MKFDTLLFCNNLGMLLIYLRIDEFNELTNDNMPYFNSSILLIRQFVDKLVM